MQHGKQLFWARLQLLARLTLNPGNYAANQPARLAQLDDGNDRAILVQGDEGPAQVVRLGHRGTPSIKMQRRSCHLLAARPIESSGSAQARTTTGSASCAPPGQSNAPAARPRLERRASTAAE